MEALPKKDVPLEGGTEKDSTRVSNGDMMKSVGATGTKIFGGQIYEEYNPKLAGLKGLEVYEEMRRSDAQVNACLLAFELPIRSTLWSIDPGATIDGAEEAVTDSDLEIQKFVEGVIFDMQTTWDDLLRQILSMVTFGYSVFEKVYAMKDEKIVLQNLSQRLARTVYKWNREEDGRYGITQNVLMNDEMKPFTIELSADKIVVFTFRREGDNMEGISALRSAYKHWYIKDTLYKLDAVKHERQSVGIPVITLPAVHEESDETEAEEILQNLRATEKSFVVLPSPDWKFEFADMGGSKVVDTEKSINHHNGQIVQNILAGFLELGKAGNGGSYALSEDQSSLFLLSLTALANQVCGTFNRHIIPELVDLNFDLVEGQRYPQLTFQKLGEVKYSEFATSLSTLTGAGLLTPDSETEEHVRKLYDLPKKAESENEEMEDLDETEEAGEMETDADAESEIETEAEPTDEDLAAEQSALEDEMANLEASELENLYALNEEAVDFSDDLTSSLSFAAVNQSTREKIRQGLIAYWDKKGRKKKPTMQDRNYSFKTRAKSAGDKIKTALDSYKSKIDPLKKEIETLKAQKAAGKISKNALSAKVAALRSQIKAIKSEKDENVGLLRAIRRDALQGAKQTRENISKRKKAVAAVIKKVMDEVKAKNATRSESIRSLASQVKANVEAYKALKAQAKSSEEKKNLKAFYSGIKAENESLRAAAKKIKDDASSDRAAAKAQKETLKKSVAEMSEPDIESLKANGFADADELQDFLAARKFFDPSILVRVQNYVQS